MLHDFKNFDSYLIYSEPDGKYAGLIIASPLSIHFARYDMYRSWDYKKILVYEAFITYSQMFGNPFFRTEDNLSEDLRLPIYSIQKNIKFLISDGYITKVKGGESEDFKNFYTVNYDKIIEDVNKIYNFEVLDSDTEKGVRELYVEKFEMYKNRAVKHEKRFPFFH